MCLIALQALVTLGVPVPASVVDPTDAIIASTTEPVSSEDINLVKSCLKGRIVSLLDEPALSDDNKNGVLLTVCGMSAIFTALRLVQQYDRIYRPGDKLFPSGFVCQSMLQF